MRQEGEVLGDAVLAEDFAEGLVVTTADLHAGAETLAHALLGAHPIRSAKNGVPAAHGLELGLHLLLRRGQGLAVGDLTLQGSEAIAIFLLLALDEGPAALATAGDLDHLVDDAHVFIVVNDDLGTVHFPINLAPEFDVILDARRNREGRVRGSLVNRLVFGVAGAGATG